MNQVTIMGRIGRDPETRFTQANLKVTTFSLAVSVRKGGQEDTVWWRVTVWGERFDKMMPYIKKGSPLIVIGEMAKPTIYTDKEGKPQVSMEMTADVIKFNPFGTPEGRPNQEGASNQPQQSSTPHQGSGGGYGGQAPSYAPPQHGTAPSYSSSIPSDDQLPF